MTGPGRFASLFDAIDSSDMDAFSRWLSEDCTFVYGSNPPVQGLAAVREVVGGFLAGFAAVEHRVHAVWEVQGVAVTEGTVTYTTRDGRGIAVPFCNVLRLAEDGRVRDYRIYVDPSPLS